MATLTILHLSDIHISDSHFVDQKVIIDALVKDIEAQKNNGIAYDLIVFSGDLISKGSYSDVNQKLAEEEFVAPLLKAASVTSDRFFMVPGNHDLETKKIPITLKPSFEALNSVDQVNQMIDGVESSPFFWVGFSAFNSILERVCGSVPVLNNDLFRAYSVTVNGIKIGVCCINSAWRATGAPNNGDYGHLLIGQRQIDNLLSAVSDCQIKIAILHHPLSWLAPFDQTSVQQQIFREFDGVFYGHNHSADSLHIAGPQYSTFVSNSGCLYQSREWFNGYSIIRYDTEALTWNVRVREYYGNRNVFDVSTRFCENGESTFVVSRDRSGVKLISFPSSDYISAVQELVNGHLLTSSISDVAPKNLRSIFVQPPLSHISERQLNEDSSNGSEINYLDLSTILTGNKSVFFVGQKESGKTTLLHYICAELEDSRVSGVPLFGCYINLDSVKSTVAGILEAIVNFSKGAYRRAEFVDLLKAGRMVVCFDNLPVHDDKVLGAIKSFLEEYPDNNFYFSVSETFQSSISQRVIPRLGLAAPVVYLHSFGRRQTRALIERWFGEANEELRDRVDAMLSSLRRLNIPRTPFLISALLWIQEKNIAFNPVNQAEIIDILVDGILDKLRETKERSGYDSTVKRHFLTEFAYALHKSDRKRCSHNELDQLVVDYFSNKGLPSASGPFIDELKKKGVIVDFGGQIGFKFECLRAFFLSMKIKESTELREYSLTPDGFVRLSEELDYFTGKNRAEKDALVGAMKVVEVFYKNAGIDIDLELFDKISLNESPITAERKVALEKKLLGDRPTFEKQEQLLDEMDDPYCAVPVIEIPSAAPESNMSNFLSALQTASAILRNSELIDDVELKRSSYIKLVEYWSRILMVILASIELYVDDQEKAAVKEAVPGMPKEFSVYILKLLVPNAIFAMALESIGTSKLELMIRSDIEETSPTICKLLSTVLYVDLELNDRLSVIKALTDRVGASRFLLEIVFFKLLHLFMFRRLAGNEEAKIRPMLGDIFARLSEAKNQKASDNIKVQIMKHLDKKRLVKQVVGNGD